MKPESEADSALREIDLVTLCPNEKVMLEGETQLGDNGDCIQAIHGDEVVFTVESLKDQAQLHGRNPPEQALDSPAPAAAGSHAMPPSLCVPC